MRFLFQKATDNDRDYLLSLRKLTMVEHLERAGKFLSDTEHTARVNDHYHCAYLVLAEGNVIGTLKYQSGESDVKIMQLQIHPDYQNKGYGRGVIQQVLNEAKPKTVSLTVLKGNPAMGLYLRLGFCVIGEDDYEYHMRFTQ